jgi:aspartate/methionine/tyrosine aminotransferase
MTKAYSAMSREELVNEKEKLSAIFKDYCAKKYSFNMARGKSGSEQLVLSMKMLDEVNSSGNLIAEGGIDCRNYGELTGIPEAKRFFAELMEVSTDEIIVAGSSSLNLMYDCLARAMLKGVLGSEKPWMKEDKVKFLCPVPGYDRHFSICEFLGIEMITIPTYEDGPDMDLIEKLASEDASIKGMWCVPKFSNPLGITYSDEVIRRMASFKTAAKDFRIFCDNAYAIHEVYRDVPLLNPLKACKEAGNPDRIYIFSSTSKITFPGSGVAFMSASKENITFTAKQLFFQIIGWDKINMLRHVRFLKDRENTRALMKKHADIIRPKFDAVLLKLESELKGLGAGSWIKPDGGYFITFIAENNCAKRIVSLCKEAGVILTEAGGTHPYGKDPEDRYIRIAPTFPSQAELEKAMEVFCVAAKLATLERLSV